MLLTTLGSFLLQHGKAGMILRLKSEVISEAICKTGWIKCEIAPIPFQIKSVCHSHLTITIPYLGECSLLVQFLLVTSGFRLLTSGFFRVETDSDEMNGSCDCCLN